MTELEDYILSRNVERRFAGKFNKDERVRYTGPNFSLRRVGTVCNSTDADGENYTRLIFDGDGASTVCENVNLMREK